VLERVSPALGKELKVEPRPGASLRGEVRDASSGEPIVAAEVSLERRGKAPHRASTDASGTFEFRNLSAENYTVFIHHPPHVAVRSEVTLEANQEGVLPRISLQPGGGVAGDVVDRFGVPVGGAEVALGEPPRWNAGTRSDATGRFQMGGVTPGEQPLWARHGQAGEMSTPVRVRIYPSQESPGLVLRLPGALR
jgi:hypothetical protein